MSPEYISYETLVANRDAALWAFWSMIGTWVAGAMTFAAVCVCSFLSTAKAKTQSLYFSHVCECCRHTLQRWYRG